MRHNKKSALGQVHGKEVVLCDYGVRGGSAGIGVRVRFI